MGVLAMSGQARALQYAFFAERAAQKVIYYLQIVLQCLNRGCTW